MKVDELESGKEFLFVLRLNGRSRYY